MAKRWYSVSVLSNFEKKVTEAQLFDLGVAKEAQARLAKDKPFDK